MRFLHGRGWLLGCIHFLGFVYFYDFSIVFYAMLKELFTLVHFYIVLNPKMSSLLMIIYNLTSQDEIQFSQILSTFKVRTWVWFCDQLNGLAIFFIYIDHEIFYTVHKSMTSVGHNTPNNTGHDWFRTNINKKSDQSVNWSQNLTLNVESIWENWWSNRKI